MSEVPKIERLLAGMRASGIPANTPEQRKNLARSRGNNIAQLILLSVGGELTVDSAEIKVGEKEIIHPFSNNRLRGDFNYCGRIVNFNIDLKNVRSPDITTSVEALHLLDTRKHARRVPDTPNDFAIRSYYEGVAVIFFQHEPRFRFTDIESHMLTQAKYALTMRFALLKRMGNGLFAAEIVQLAPLPRQTHGDIQVVSHLKDKESRFSFSVDSISHIQRERLMARIAETGGFDQQFDLAALQKLADQLPPRVLKF